MAASSTSSEAVDRALVGGAPPRCQRDLLCASRMAGARFAVIPGAIPPLQAVYRTADGFIALVGWFRPAPLSNVCRALALPDYAQEPRFATLPRRCLLPARHSAAGAR